MPAVLARLVGEWSPVAVILAGGAVAVVVLCFAEVGSRFDGTGGPYLYPRSVRRRPCVSRRLAAHLVAPLLRRGRPERLHVTSVNSFPSVATRPVAASR
jgi:hypothetical protein